MRRWREIQEKAAGLIAENQKLTSEVDWKTLP
jgi:hypothetical protein